MKKVSGSDARVDLGSHIWVTQVQVNFMRKYSGCGRGRTEQNVFLSPSLFLSQANTLHTVTHTQADLLSLDSPPFLAKCCIVREKPKSVQCTGCSHFALLSYLSGGCLHGASCFLWVGLDTRWWWALVLMGWCRYCKKTKTKYDPRITNTYHV